MTHMYKVIVFAPKSNVDKLISVMGDAGAGKIGNYSHCAFVTQGNGTWIPLPGANPTEGNIGEICSKEEYKIEMFCSKVSLTKVVSAIRKTHSYETPEINIVELVHEED